MVRLNFRAMTSLLCSGLLVASLPGCGRHRVTLPEIKPSAQVFEPLQAELRKSYPTLFETASKLEYNESHIAQMHEYLKQAQDYCTGRLEGASREYGRRVEEAQRGLNKPDLSDADRHNLHCTIQDTRAPRSQAEVISQHAIPTAYENKRAGTYESYLDASSCMSLMQAQAFLQMLASKSGGFAWFPNHPGAFSDVMQGIMQSIATPYRVVYESEAPRSGKFRKIRVEAFRIVNDRREDFKVLVREGWR